MRAGIAVMIRVFAAMVSGADAGAVQMGREQSRSKR
jgi:hypothetical protein